MSHPELAVAAARKEVAFWQELAEHLKLPEPGILSALKQAEKRYEKALQLPQTLKPNEL
jgi:hypothetical protein